MIPPNEVGEKGLKSQWSPCVQETDVRLSGFGCRGPLECCVHILPVLSPSSVGEGDFYTVS